MATKLLDVAFEPDIDGMLGNLRRQGNPKRVHVLELFEDAEIKNAVAERYGLGRALDTSDPFFALRREIEIQRFLGYELFRIRLSKWGFPRDTIRTVDTTESPDMRRKERAWTDEHGGPIQSMADMEKYPWPDPDSVDLSEIEWCEQNLDPRMGIYVGCHQIFEQVTWLMGYEVLCYRIHDEPDLVRTLFTRIGELHLRLARRLCGFRCVKALFGGDDMGFKTGTMVAPEVLVNWAFPWHKRMADVAHRHGKLYLLHACGNLDAVMEPLIEDVRIDGKHSFEDVIEPVTVAKSKYGNRIALIGGIDVDFLCRADEGAIRARVRRTLDACMPGGGYCLGSGNSVANYIPLDNYLVMLDEGRRYAT